MISEVARAATPLLLATIGEIYAERSGVLNLGVEGMMILGASLAFLVANVTSNIYLAILLASLAGSMLALIHAFFSISLKANQVISGLALSMLGIGMSSIIGRSMIGVPLEVGIESFAQNTAIAFPIFLSIFSWFLLFKTRLGIKIRACGDDPEAASSAGVNVRLIRYACVAIGGALAGLAGAYLSLFYTRMWIENMTAGMGWIAISLTIFSLWNPLLALIGAYLFGMLRILQYSLQPLGISAPLLMTIPYITVILTFITLHIKKFRKFARAPAALGKPF